MNELPIFFSTASHSLSWLYNCSTVIGIAMNNSAIIPMMNTLKYDTPLSGIMTTVYPKYYAHGFVVLCFVVVMQSFIMNSHEVFIDIHQGCFAGTGAIVRLPQCQWRKPDGYGKVSQCITTTKHSKAKTVCIFLGIYFIFPTINLLWDIVLNACQ